MATRALLWLVIAALLGSVAVVGVYVLTDGTMDVGDLSVPWGDGGSTRDLGPGDGVVVYPLR